jgi:hypothetical protein
MGEYQRKVVVFFLVLLSVSAAHGATMQTCPWLNAATAAGVLEGPVMVSVTYLDPDNRDATCEFTYRVDHTVRALRIEVNTMKDPSHDFPQYVAKCGPDAKALPAIGNEAIRCRIPGYDKQVAEQVVSRVRERAFTVGVLSNESVAKPDVIRDKTRKIAEQVAGFLF